MPNPTFFPTGPFTASTPDTYYHITPRAGLVYEIVPENLSIYGTFVQSFDPPPGGLYTSPIALKPEIGQMWEGGVKAQLLENLIGTLAGYYIVKNNVTTQTGLLTATQVGEQQSQGLEASLTGNITERWSAIANYAYTDTRVNNFDPTVQVGGRVRGIPLNSGSVWTRYNLLQRDDHVFGSAIGLVYVGDRFGDLNHTFALPEYTRWDMGLYYRRGALNASMYIENVFDRHYYAGSITDVNVYAGNPFTIRGNFGFSY